MIRINLLGLKKDVKKSSVPSVSLEGAKLTGMVLGFLGLALVVLAYHYYSLQSDQTRLNNEQREAEKEKTRLAAVKGQYEQFQAYKQELTHRIDVIEALKKGQTGPVEMLTQLASAVQASKTMWITSFDSAGGKVSIEGVALDVLIVADFIRNLKNTGYFKNVEIKETYQDELPGDLSSFKFTLTAEIEQPAAAAMPAAGKPK